MKHPAILPASATSQPQSYDSQRGEKWVNWLFQVTEFMKKLSREHKSDLAKCVFKKEKKNILSVPFSLKQQEGTESKEICLFHLRMYF